MKALITGAAGFVGANLVRRLVAEGHEAIAVIRPAGDPWRLTGIEGECTKLPLDLEDPALEQRVVAQQPDVVFHLAAHGAYSWQQDLGKMLAVNLRATQALLDAVIRIDARMIHAGSSSEYGYKDHPPREGEIARPNSQYAVTKLGATNLCQVAADRHGARVATLRLYSVYGPWEEPGRLMPTIVRAARAGRWPPLVDPTTARDFVWVDDACDAFLAAATRPLAEPGTIYNIASAQQTTLAQLVAVTAGVFGVSAPPQWGTMPQRRWDTAVWVGDAERACEELGWSATTSLDTGLKRFSAWFDEHPLAEARYR